VGRAFRAPTFNERFYEPGGTPTLRAERGWNAETGVEVRLGSERRALRSEVTAFVTRLTNKIVWQPSYVGPGLQVWRPRNRAQVLSRGVEWTTTGHWRVAPATRLRGRLTFAHVSATDRSMPQARAYGKQLPYTPRERLKSQLGLGWRWLRLDVSARLVGPRYVTADESQSLPPYQVVDTQLQVQHALGPATVTAQLSVQNLLDTDYSVVRLYPMPPRHARARLTVGFTP
jgi:iron complex outermembrane receptor protein